MTFIRIVYNYWDRIISDYNRAINNPNIGDWWFEEFYNELESMVYRGVIDGEFTLKEVEEFAERDSETDIGYSVGNLFDRMWDKQREEKGADFDDCQTYYDEWIKHIEIALEGKLKETAKEAEIRYCDVLCHALVLLNQRIEEETQKTIVKKKSTKKKAIKKKATKKKTTKKKKR
jgi:hypothetical protein